MNFELGACCKIVDSQTLSLLLLLLLLLLGGLCVHD
jgi:hypothetical protein